MFAEKVNAVLNDLGKKSNKEVADRLRVIAKELEDEAEAPEIADYRKLLQKMKGKDGIKKLKIFIDNPRMRKPIRYWLDRIDKGEGAGDIDFNEMIKKIKQMIKMDMPAVRFLKMLLDYGVNQGHVGLNRILEKGRAKVTLMRDAE